MSGKARGWAVAGVVFGGVIILVLTVFVTARDTQDKVDPLAAGLLQFILAAGTLLASYLLGKRDASTNASAVLRPHGRKAVRRIVNLTNGIQSFGAVVSLQRGRLRARAARSGGGLTIDDMEAAFEVLDIQVIGQLRTAEDALEDWRDVVPEDVETVLREGQEAQRQADLGEFFEYEASGEQVEEIGGREY